MTKKPGRSFSNKRLDSLDVFRGRTITAMVLVNTPGSHEHLYPLLKHAAWHGCTVADAYSFVPDGPGEPFFP